MNNSMVAHLWANEKTDYAYGSNFYCSGKSIYSYGSHFEVARIVTNKKGEKAYLFNETRYSSSTAKHQCYVKSAIPDDSLVFETGGDFRPESSYEYPIGCVKQIKEHLDKYKKAKTQICDCVDVVEMYRNIENFLRFYDMGTVRGLLKMSLYKWSRAAYNRIFSKEHIAKAKELRETLRVMVDLSTKFDYDNIEEIIVRTALGDKVWFDYEERCERWKNSREERYRKRVEREQREQEMRLKPLEEIIQAWKNLETNNFPFFIAKPDKPNTYIRLNKKKIQTSKGVDVTLEEGRRLWLYVKALHDGAMFTHELALDMSGHRWKVDKFENDMLSAGCHRIAYSNMLEIAIKLGWYEER